MYVCVNTFNKSFELITLPCDPVGFNEKEDNDCDPVRVDEEENNDWDPEEVDEEDDNDCDVDDDTTIIQWIQYNHIYICMFLIMIMSIAQHYACKYDEFYFLKWSN